MSGIMTKCTRYEFCDALKKSLSDGHRGVHIDIIFSFSKGKETGIVAKLYSGEYRKCGATMWFCPFCGKKLGKLPTSDVRRAHRERLGRAS